MNQYMKIGAIIQARTASSRLPNKVLMELPYNSGITVCSQVIRRVKKAKLLNTVILATTNSKADEILIEIAKNEKIDFFRGFQKNVLKRFYGAAYKNKLDIIVRLTCDNPCIDWSIIDGMIEYHLKNKFDYTNSMYTGKYPNGTNVEVFYFRALQSAVKYASKSYEKEHVTPYFYDTARENFKISPKVKSKKTVTDKMRLTLDTNEDYALLCEIFDNLYFRKKYFTLEDIKSLYTEKPWLGLINYNIHQKTYME